MAPGEESRGGKVELGPFVLQAPDAWFRRPPRSEFVLAEFRLPRTEGDSADGRLTISRAGGSVQDNIDRWKGQFAGKPEKETQEKLVLDGTKATLLDLSGTYGDQAGPFAPAEQRPGYRMLAAIIETDGQLCFVKAYGPGKTMASHADEFRAFLKTLKLSRPGT